MNNQKVDMYTEDLIQDLLESFENSNFPVEFPTPFRDGSTLVDPQEVVEYLSMVPVSDLGIVNLLSDYFKPRLLYVPVTDRSGDYYLWDGTIHVNENSIEFQGSQNLELEFAKIVGAFYRTIFKYFQTNALPSIIATQSQKESADAGAKALQHAQDKAREAIYGMKKKADSYETTKVINNFGNLLKKEFSTNPGHFDTTVSQEIVFQSGKYLSIKDLEEAESVDDLITLLKNPDPNLRNLRKTATDLTQNYTNRGLWQAFLDRTVVSMDAGAATPLKDEQEALQMLAGAALLGTGQVKHVVSITGPGNSGKGSYVSMLGKILGGADSNNGYAPEVSSRSIEYGNKFNRGQLRGARLPYLQEPTEASIDGGFLKQYSGGPSQLIVTEEKNKNPVSWRPQGILHVISNHKIRFDQVDTALRERVLPFDFPHSIARDDAGYNPNFENEIIEQDGESILRWVLEGAIKFLHNSSVIKVPETVKARQDANFADSSIAVQWLQYQLENGLFFFNKDLPQEHSIKSAKTEWFDSFTIWATGEGYSEKELPTHKQWRQEIGSFIGMTDSDITRKLSSAYRFVGIGETEGANSKKYVKYIPKPGTNTWSELLAMAEH